MRNSPYTYWKEDYFKQSHDWLPNVVIIELGANDSRSETWSVYEKDFVSDYKNLIATYTDLPSEPIVFICTPCPVYENGRR